MRKTEPVLFMTPAIPPIVCCKTPVSEMCSTPTKTLALGGKQDEDGSRADSLRARQGRSEDSRCAGCEVWGNIRTGKDRKEDRACPHRPEKIPSGKGAHRRASDPAASPRPRGKGTLTGLAQPPGRKSALGAPALVRRLRMLASSAFGLQLPACTAKAGRRPSPASTDSAANRHERTPSGSQSPRGGGGPSCGAVRASFLLSQWKCPRRAAPPPSLAPRFWVPGPQRGESAAGGRGLRGRRRSCRLRRQPRPARSHEAEPRAGEPAAPPRQGQPGRPQRPERVGLPGVGSKPPPCSACLAARGGSDPSPPARAAPRLRATCSRSVQPGCRGAGAGHLCDNLNFS